MITKEAVNLNLYKEKRYYLNSSREGFKYIISKIGLGKSDRILLPSYIGINDREGSGVFDPVNECKINYNFYSIKHDLSIDIQDLEKKLLTGKYKVLLVIHYFGFCQNDMIYLMDLAKRFDLYVIEDCAHTMASYINGKALGSFGDFALKSIHKIIATNNGGILEVNNYEALFIDQSNTISKESLVSYCASNLEKIYSIRIRNYNYLLKKLGGLPGITIMYPNLTDGIVPLNFPVLVDGGRREELYFSLIEKGIVTTALWYKLIDQIDKSEFPQSYEISSKILNFPIHQDISLGDLDFIGDQTCNILEC